MATSAPDFSDAWKGSGVAEQYKLAENATRPFADIIAKKIPQNSLEGEVHVMDLACGTGAMTAALYEVLPAAQRDSARVLGADISTDMLEYLAKRGEDEGWKGLETKVVDAKDMELPQNVYTHFFITFGVFVMPNGTVQKCHDATKPGGFIGISVWKRLPWYSMVSRAIERLPSPPSYIPTEADIMSMVFAKRPWQDPAYLRKELEDAGFEEVDIIVEDREVETGTAEQFTYTMDKVLGMVGMFWPEDGRAELVNGVKRELLTVAKEEIGEGGSVKMKFEGIVGTGLKKV